MKEFNYKQWLRENKSGPYQKTLLFESEDQRFNVIAKTKGHLVAYPDQAGSYTKSELTTWQTKGQDAGVSRKLDWVDSREEAMRASDDIQEDTYDQTYNGDGGAENPQPEDEQFQESMYDLYRNPGDTNSAIEYYSDAELDSNNDQMPFDYSKPNPGLDAGRDAAWKPKPFNNGERDYSQPHKYGW